MAKIGNNSGNRFGQKKERVTLKDYNDAWAAVRKKSIQKTQALSKEVLGSVYQATVTNGQQQTYNAFQGSNISTASALGRLNILV
jgi:hypothetical protein